MLGNIRKYLKLGIILIINTFTRLVPSKTEEYYDLVIVRSDAIGDFVLWLDCIRAYRRKYINKKVLLICPVCDKEIALKVDFFSEVITYNHKQIICNIKYYNTVKKKIVHIGSDQLIMPSRTHQFGADLICSLINSKKKITTAPKVEIATYTLVDRIVSKLIDLGIVGFLKSFFTDFVTLPQNGIISDFEDNRFFTNNVIDDSYESRLTDLSFIYKDYSPLINDSYCLISLSSSNILKNWPNERVSEIIKIIPPVYTVVLSGYGDDDMLKAQYLIKNNIRNHKLINTVNKTSITDLICLISKASFVLGNDSAAIHIAAACHVPSICYTHGAHFGRYVPYPKTLPEKQYHPHCVFVKMDCYGCGYRCNKEFNPNQPFYCLRQVSVEMVKNELEILLHDIKYS